jgi:hypothetical protein
MKTKWCRKWRRRKRFWFQCPAVDGSCLVGSVKHFRCVCLVPSFSYLIASNGKPSAGK